MFNFSGLCYFGYRQRFNDQTNDLNTKREQRKLRRKDTPHDKTKGIFIEPEHEESDSPSPEMIHPKLDTPKPQYIVSEEAHAEMINYKERLLNHAVWNTDLYPSTIILF